MGQQRVVTLERGRVGDGELADAEGVGSIDTTTHTHTRTSSPSS